ncbi:Papain family cysteine protease [Phytophthora infestans]|uniref:Papain family cysteine protease n=1 Tax=Phytophthora infestans TaxID=4787 RepID=A0A833T6D8_PHYIN|nr:Papain family cysteine protease [Phytophthora infestans]
MQSRNHFIQVAAAAAMAVFGVDGRQMHAGLDYHRYLAERAETRQELADWKANFGEMAQNNGWMPPSSGNSEERSTDDEDEDHLQRFYMTKQNISAIQALNPNANFSVNTPFTLLTNDEFAAYVGKSYRAYNASSVSTTRRLRSWHRSSNSETTYSSSSPAKTTTTSTSSRTNSNPMLSGAANGGTTYDATNVKTVTSTGADGKSTTTTTTTTSSGPGRESTTVSTSSGSTPSNFGFGSDFSSLWQQWGNGFNFGGMGRNDFQPETVKPAGSNSISTITDAPSTPLPTTAAPTPTPTETTVTPSTTSPPKTSTSPATVTATDTSSTSSRVDWADSSCMSPIQSQGSCGDCWAFSTAAAIESGQCIHGGQKTLQKYSEQQLTSCDSQNHGCSGGAPIYAMKYVQQNGLCTENDYPFTSSDGTAASCSTGCSAVDTGIKGYKTVDDASGLASAVAQQPVIIAVASGNNAWKQYTGGVISSCDTSELDHAVVVVGYTDSEWKIRNSWGDSWGEEGYIRLERTSDTTGTCGMYGDMSYPTF